MTKETLEAALRARYDDSRALRGAIAIVKGKPRIVFGVVGDHRRFSAEVVGNKITLIDDPCANSDPETDKAPEESEIPDEKPKGKHIPPKK